MIPGGKVFIIGAGPGAPDLITVRGIEILRSADLVIYAGSLVSAELIAQSPGEAEKIDSSGLHLEEIVTRMVAGVRRGWRVARLHSGDPSVYGAIQEQIERLRAHQVPFEIVPGVSSVFAAAACLNTELTVPGVSQTVILTRTEGRSSPLPEGAALRELARIPATLAIFLSAALAGRVVDELRSGGLGDETPVAVVARVSWPDEITLWSTLGRLRADLRAAGIQRQALFLIGPALNAQAVAATSRLYARDYTHMFRRSDLS
ncbi:MAG: precorrin-4 C(11)-methyltransferase [Thermaerobacter sp.]|nr:precorrin-4 C(11)-methyltransferase [Thermaerobacter sp.]